MPLFKVRLIFEFARHPADRVPDGLLDKDGRVIRELAWWPDTPLEIRAPNEHAAVDLAQRQQTEPLMICIEPRVGEARFRALEMRPRTGSAGKYSSLTRNWITQQEGDENWYSHYVPPAPPRRGRITRSRLDGRP
jgi:hypothetical protein